MWHMCKTNSTVYKWWSDWQEIKPTLDMPAVCAPLPAVSPVCLLHLAADEPLYLHLFE